MPGNVMPVEIQPGLLRPLAYRTLSKKHGLNIKSDGLKELATYIGTKYGILWKKNSNSTISFLEKFADIWKEQERGLFVDGEGVKQIIKEIKENENATSSVISETTKTNPTNANNLNKFLSRASEKDDQDSLDNDTMDMDDLDMAMSTNNETNVVNEEINDGANSRQGSTDEMDQVLYDEEEKEEASVRKAIEQMEWTDYFKIIDAFDQQNFQFDANKKTYVLKPKIKNIISSPSSSASKLVTRYELIKERVLRNEDFNNDQEMYNPLSSIKYLEQDLQLNNDSNSDSNTMATHMQITPIKNLIGRNSQNFLLLGMIRINEKGEWALEDPSGSITIDIQQTIPTQGTFYFPGCTVIAEGIYYTVGNKFYVTSMTSPPSERREEFMKVIGDLDLLGVHSASSNSYYSRINDDLKLKLNYLNLELTENKFVFLGGDLFLDELKTFEALPKILEALNNDPPVAIVFNGSFSSVPIYPSLSSKHNSLSAEYKNNFDMFASLLSQYKNLTNHTNLIFVPGANDPWGTMASLGSKNMTFPQLAVPSFFTEKLKKTSKKCHFVTNPSKIAYLSLEFLLVRDAIYERMKRHTIQFPSLEENEPDEKETDALIDIDDSDVENLCEPLSKTLKIDTLIKGSDQTPAKVTEARKIVKTILDQGHISPFLPSTRPVNWDLDHTMHLSPLPSFISLCDTSANMFDVTYNGCKVVNCGSFFGDRRKINYTEYIPSLRRAYQKELNY